MIERLNRVSGVPALEVLSDRLLAVESWEELLPDS